MALGAREDTDVKKALERYIMERVQDRVRFYETTECHVEIGKNREILVRLNGSIPKIWHENTLCMAFDNKSTVEVYGLFKTSWRSTIDRLCGEKVYMHPLNMRLFDDTSFEQMMVEYDLQKKR